MTSGDAYSVGRRAAKFPLWLDTHTAMKLATVYHDFKCRVPHVAELWEQGRTANEIATALGWDLRSVQKVLRPIREWLREIVGNRDTRKRLYRGTTA